MRKCCIIVVQPHFRCIDGTGILIKQSRTTLLEGNHVVETRLLPTREIQAQRQLGTFVKRNEP